MSKKREKLVKKLNKKEYRDAWVEESVKTVVPFQIQAIRTHRRWTQAQLGAKAGMLPHAITRVESADYGNLSVNTLLRIAHGFDCGLLVKFVPFCRLVQEFEDVSEASLRADKYETDAPQLARWAKKPSVESEETIAKFLNDINSNRPGSTRLEHDSEPLTGTISGSPDNREQSFVLFGA